MLEHRTIHQWNGFAHQVSAPHPTALLIKKPEELNGETMVLERIMHILSNYWRAMHVSLGADDADTLELEEPSIKESWQAVSKTRQQFFRQLFPGRQSAILQATGTMLEVIEGFDFDLLMRGGEEADDAEEGSLMHTFNTAVYTFCEDLYRLFDTRPELDVLAVRMALESRITTHCATRSSIDRLNNPHLRSIPEIEAHRNLVLPMYLGKDVNA